MGRGLSELQKTILLMAYENHKKYTGQTKIRGSPDFPSSSKSLMKRLRTES